MLLAPVPKGEARSWQISASGPCCGPTHMVPAGSTDTPPTPKHRARRPVRVTMKLECRRPYECRNLRRRHRVVAIQKTNDDIALMQVITRCTQELTANRTTRKTIVLTVRRGELPHHHASGVPARFLSHRLKTRSFH